MYVLVPTMVIVTLPKIVSEYDQEIQPQSHTAANPVAPRGRAAQPSRATRKTNQAKQPALSSPLQDGSCAHIAISLIQFSFLELKYQWP